MMKKSLGNQILSNKYLLWLYQAVLKIRSKNAKMDLLKALDNWSKITLLEIKLCQITHLKECGNNERKKSICKESAPMDLWMRNILYEGSIEMLRC